MKHPLKHFLGASIPVVDDPRQVTSVCFWGHFTRQPAHAPPTEVCHKPNCRSRVCWVVDFYCFHGYLLTQGGTIVKFFCKNKLTSLPSCATPDLTTRPDQPPQAHREPGLNWPPDRQRDRVRWPGAADDLSQVNIAVIEPAPGVDGHAPRGRIRGLARARWGRYRLPGNNADGPVRLAGRKRNA